MNEDRHMDRNIFFDKDMDRNRKQYTSYFHDFYVIIKIPWINWCQHSIMYIPMNRCSTNDFKKQAVFDQDIIA